MMNIINPIILPNKKGKYIKKDLKIRNGFKISIIILSYIPRHNKKNELLTPGNTFPKENNIPPIKYLKKE